MAIDDRKRIFLIKKWYKLQNITLVKRAWRTKYKFEPVPHYSTIKNYVTKFEKNVSAANSTNVFWLNWRPEGNCQKQGCGSH